MQKISFRHLVLAGISLAWLPAIAGAQTLLVVNQGDVNVSLVDPVAGREVAKVAEQTGGEHGHEVAASADGRLAFVPIYGSTGLGGMGGRCWSSMSRHGKSWGTSISGMECGRTFRCSIR